MVRRTSNNTENCLSKNKKEKKRFGKSWSFLLFTLTALWRNGRLLNAYFLLCVLRFAFYVAIIIVVVSLTFVDSFAFISIFVYILFIAVVVKICAFFVFCLVLPANLAVCKKSVLGKNWNHSILLRLFLLYICSSWTFSAFVRYIQFHISK